MIDDVPEGAIFIGLVRHPIDRFVSCYSDTTRPHRIFLIETNRYTHAPIPGTYAGMPIEALADVVERYPCANAHWVPQARWLSWRGSLPDHVVRYETLYDDWAGLRHRYPELPPFPAERLNASPRGRWEIVVPPGALREQLVRVYREDFEVFGYPIP